MNANFEKRLQNGVSSGGVERARTILVIREKREVHIWAFLTAQQCRETELR